MPEGGEGMTSLPKLTPGDPVQVRWIDANSPDGNAWQTIDAYKESCPKMEILSIGYFVELRKGYLRLSGERSDSKDYVEVVNRTFNVPVACIQSIRRLRK
jgi:hypothetical protein